MLPDIAKPETGSPSLDSISMASTVHEAVDLEANHDGSAPHLTTTRTPNSTNEKQLTGILSRTLSRVRTSDSIHPGPPPDGGRTAWTMVALAHLTIFNTWGFVNTFGVFLTYYVDTMHLGNSSEVAWVGSIQILLLFGLGTLSGRGTDAGYFKLIFVAGSLIQLLGIFSLSWCTTYWQVFLSQGLVVGIGNGLVFIPAVTIASTYFLKNRALALGFCASGSATGGMVYPAIAQQLLPRIGFAWLVRVFGFIMMFGMVVGAVGFKPRLPPRKGGAIVDWTAFTELPFIFFCLFGFFIFWGIFVGFYYIGTFAIDVLHVNQATSINLLLTMNGIGIPTRLILAYFSDKIFGPLNSIMPFVAVTAIVLYSWIAVNSVAGVWIFAVVYGLVVAGIQGLFPAVLTSLTTNPQKMGVRTGMGFGIAGLASFSGPPLAGALIQKGSGSYLYAQLFAATAPVVAFIALNVCRWTQVGFKVKAKL